MMQLIHINHAYSMMNRLPLKGANFGVIFLNKIIYVVTCKL